MKEIHTENNTIDSKNQSGGITAQSVTINHNHYAPFSKTLEKVKIIIKTNPIKCSLLLILLSLLGFVPQKWIFSSPISTKEEFHKFLLRYQQSVRESREDAEDYFADRIGIFYTKRNITPPDVNKERRDSDFRGGENNVDLSSITLRKAGDINYWRYKDAVICWRPSKNMFQKCMVEMEFGLNKKDKIVSIEQIRFWDLNYYKDKPTW